MNIKYCLMIALALLLPTRGFSSPAITSVSVSGATYTITGTGFGTKSPAAPAIWDNFESGSASSAWDTINERWGVVEDNKQNSSYALRCDRGRVNSVDLMKDIGETDNIYVFVKRRWDFSVIDRNQKFLRIYALPAGSNDNYSIAWNYLSESPTHRCEFFCRDSYSPFVGDGASVYSGEYSWDYYPQPGKWLREEFFVKMPSDTDECDGEMGYRVNANQYEYFPTNRCISPAEHPGPYRYVFIDNFGSWYDHMVCEGSPDASYDEYDCLPLGSYIWVDDIYIDNTWSRVVIGNSQAYGDCTHIEIQIPTSWSDTSITVTRNTGEFLETDEMYLFVIDADNAPSSGYYLSGYKNINGNSHFTNIGTGASKVTFK